jgi:hypothetical protein
MPSDVKDPGRLNTVSPEPLMPQIVPLNEAPKVNIPPPTLATFGTPEPSKPKKVIIPW